MRKNPMTPEQRERQLAYQREYSRTKRKERAEADQARTVENRRKIAAAILAYEILQKQAANG
jgi:hypothetical protein